MTAGSPNRVCTDAFTDDTATAFIGSSSGILFAFNTETGELQSYHQAGSELRRVALSKETHSVAAVRSAPSGDEVTIMGTVWDAGEKRVRGGASIFQAILSDGSGTIQCTWFNPYVANQIKHGGQIVVSGKVSVSKIRSSGLRP